MIFLDIEMPVKNGYDGIKLINQFYIDSELEKTQTIFIACTGYDLEEEEFK